MAQAAQLEHKWTIVLIRLKHIHVASCHGVCFLSCLAHARISFCALASCHGVRILSCLALLFLGIATGGVSLSG